jgi:hypothetical protein
VTDSTLRAFLLQLHTAYLPNAYHNFTHAFDVTHAIFVTLVAFDARKYLRPIDMFALMIAGISHDVGHPGAVWCCVCCAVRLTDSSRCQQRVPGCDSSAARSAVQ